jgi:membrane protease YdiL (CAAX protease family)
LKTQPFNRDRRNTMSDISHPLAHRTSEPLSPAQSAALAQPLGLWATLGWGAAGIAALMITLLAGRLLDVLGHPGVQLPWLLQFLPTGHIAAVAVVGAAVWLSGRRFGEYLALIPLRWRDVGRGIGYGLLGYVGLFIIYALYPLVFGTGAPNAVEAMPLQQGKALVLISVWIGMVIAAPIAEELVYRGLLYRGLEGRLGALAAIMLTSVAFGLLHYPGFGWMRVVGTGSFSLMLGWLRWRTGSTSVCIVAHATTNVLGAAAVTLVVLAS